MNEKQREILVITQEECAEVIQEISKIFRFGIDEFHKDGMLHQTKLEMEVGDLMCMVDLLIQHGLIDQQKIEIAKENKQQKLRKWSKIYD
jgi:NTP pyrophosphatase (non-canonical NTP hydrolase)